MDIVRAQASEVARAIELFWGEGAPVNVTATEGLWVARDAGVLRSAIYAVMMPGGSSLLHPPAFGDRVVVDRLMRSALESLTPAFQTESFLRPEEMVKSITLERHGFRHTTTILEMSAPKRLVAPLKFHEQLIAADRVPPEVLKDLLFRCHQDSLDCPEASAHQTVESLWAVYREMVPDLGGWLVAIREEKPVGIAIYSPSDLCFLGVVPEARQRGIGKQLLSFVLTQFAPLQLATDCRNQPAVTLYHRLGFEVTGRREFFLRPNPTATSASSFNEK